MKKVTVKFEPVPTADADGAESGAAEQQASPGVLRVRECSPTGKPRNGGLDRTIEKPGDWHEFIVSDDAGIVVTHEDAAEGPTEEEQAAVKAAQG